MRPRKTDEPLISIEHVVTLRRLIDALPEDVDAGDPAFVALLDAWEACKVPWDARPTVGVYRVKGGRWLTHPDIPHVVKAISAHVR